MQENGNTQKLTKRNLTRELTYSALLVAMAFVLSFIKVFQLPYGGSVTLFSMLPVAVTAYLFGMRAGLVSGTALGLINFIAEPYVVHPVQLVLDYFIGFGVLGAGGFLRDTKAGLSGVYVVGIFLRFVCSTISGFVFFASYAEGTGLPPLLYSIVYNGLYIGAEGILTLILVNIPLIRNFFRETKEKMA